MAENVLEANREMKCPRLGCQEVLRFRDLDEDEQNYITSNRELYTIE